MTDFILLGNDPIVFYAKKSIRKQMELRHSNLKDAFLNMGVASNTTTIYRTDIDWIVYLIQESLRKYKDPIMYLSFSMSKVKQALLLIKDDYKRINLYVIDYKNTVKKVTMIKGEIFTITV